MKDELLRRPEMWRGFKTVAPLLPGVLPFAVIAGSSAVEVGIPAVQAMAMSMFIFAGASQLVMVAMWDKEAPALILLATILLVNLRFTMYSATLAPYLRGFSIWPKSLIAYLLTDQAALLTIKEFEERPRATWGFYMGAALTLWIVWQGGTAVGVFLGAILPESWSLDFAVPLSFLALLIPAIKDRPSLAAAVAGGGLVLITRHLPMNLGLIVAALGGIAAGLWAERRST